MAHKITLFAVVLTGLLIALAPTKVQSVPALTPEVSQATSTPPAPVPKTFNSEVTRLAAKYKQSETLARAIIACEAKQYGSGASNKNYDKEGVWWSTDWGWWQINDYWNEKPAAKRGFDIYDKWDNLEYGFIMLKEQGTAPWNASKGCWA